MVNRLHPRKTWKSNQVRIGTAALGALALGSGCAKDASTTAPNYCAPANPAVTATAAGTARIFSPDPMVAAGNATLAPTAANLDSFAAPVILDNLKGNGLLTGKYVDVRDGDVCGSGYGAYEAANQFNYPHSDPRFQESMAYSWGDRYRAQLATVNYLQPMQAVQIIAHCQAQENAFFYKGQDKSGNLVERVCLGYSATTQGAFYADDASVTLHELQHATTTDTYAAGPRGRLNRFWYDEAGALNEAVSDFMALTFQVPFLTPAFDAKLFSRWALGSFIPNHPSTRGAHRCPTYDPTYPACGSYPAFSAAGNTISYIYPDGVGWPYANNFGGPGYANSAFSTYKSQEEIHNAGIVLVGGLWDVYEAIKANHGGDEAIAHSLSSQLVLESIKHLAQPTSTSLSPVTFRGLATQMSLYAPSVLPSSADQTAAIAALTSRGLLGGTQLTSSWSAVGPGNAAVTPGMRVLDNPTQLKTWLISMFEDAFAGLMVPQGLDTGLNGKLDPGEFAAVWFDLQDNEATSAGAVQLTVTALDPQVTFDEPSNIGWLSASQSQIVYGKVNGTSIVTSLTSANPTYHVATGNSYFRTNPFFDHDWNTAFFVRVSATAAHGATVRFQVQALPSNGVASTSTFAATIN